MTKGKYTAAAAVRHEVQDRDTQIAVYQRAVARLTAENKDLKTKLRDQRRAAAARETELKALVEAAASPTIRALELVIEARTEQLNKLKARVKLIQSHWHNTCTRLQEHFVTAHQLRGYDATEAAMALCGDPLLEDIQIIEGVTELPRMGKIGGKASEAIQRRRGHRGHAQSYKALG